jgi:fructokinase
MDPARAQNSSSPLVAGVELGGTKCVCILARGPDDIVEQVRIDTRDPPTTFAEIAAVLRRWREDHAFEALGLASFGPIDLDPASATHGAIVRTPKPGWDGADLLSLAADLDVPVGLDTDVNAAALAEGRWGAAQGLSAFAYITVGTGVGVGSIIGGAAVRGLGHSEAGHLRVPRLPGDAWPGACPYHGDCVEGLASGPAIAALAGRSAQELDRDHPAWAVAVGALASLCHNLVLTAAPESAHPHRPGRQSPWLCAGRRGRRWD